MFTRLRLEKRTDCINLYNFVIFYLISFLLSHLLGSLVRHYQLLFTMNNQFLRFRNDNEL